VAQNKFFYINKMALPIRSTPILSGKSAERFYLMAKDVRDNKWKTVDFSEQTKLGKKILEKAKF
jgi:hypothetical protein